jgi:hypothetical protein
MAEKEAEHASRAELIFVAILFVIAGGAIAGAVLRERGIGFAPAVAEIIYRALWTVLWLPGMTMAAVLLVRTRRARLAVGLVLQVAAVVLTWIAVRFLLASATLGLLGLGLPVILPARTETLRRKSLSVLVLVALLVIGCLAEECWPATVLTVAWLTALYAAPIWPKAEPALQEMWRHEGQLRRDSRAYRWLAKVWVAFVAVLLIAMLAIAIITFVWGGGLPGWLAR